MIVSREYIFKCMRDGRRLSLVGCNVVLTNRYISPIVNVNWGCADDINNIIVLTLQNDLRIFVGEIRNKAYLQNEGIPHDEPILAHL